MELKRFWFRFASIEPLSSLRLGCGVTAYDYDDAIAILRETIFLNQELPSVDSVIEGVDVTSLDQRHVIPNMEPVIWRGVWYPKGFAFPR